MSNDLVPKLSGTLSKSELPLPKKNPGKDVSPSMSLNYSVTDTLTEQLAPLCYPTNCNLMVRNKDPEKVTNPSQVSDDVQQLTILANSVLVSPLMTFRRLPTGYLQATKVSGSSETPPSVPQIPGSQEQMMQEQMEQLKRLVAEQQRIITLYNSGNISAEEEKHQKKSLIREDKDEQSDNQIPAHLRTRNVEERTIRSGIGIKEKKQTFEEFVEERFKMDSQRAENHLKQHKQRNSCRSKTDIRKTFLKCGEGIARFEQNKENLFRKNPKQLINQIKRQVSLGCQPSFCLLQSKDWGKHKQENHPSLERHTNTHKVPLSKEKEIADIPSQEKAKEDTEHYKSEENNQKPQERSGEHVKVESTLTSRVNWPDIMQQYHSKESESKFQIDGKNETQFLECQNQLDSREEPTNNQVQQHFDIPNPPLIAKNTPVAPGNSRIQEVIEDHEKQVDGTIENHNSKKVWFISYHPNQKLVSSTAFSGLRKGSSPEFKKVNDRIVKNTQQLNEGIEIKYVLVSDHKRKQQDGGRSARLGNDKSSSSDENNSYSSSSMHCHSCPRSEYLPNVHHADQNHDFSEPDYAGDELSASEMTLRSASKLLVKKRRSQDPLRLKSHFTRTSSSESSIEASKRRGSRILSSFQISRDYYIGPRRPKKEPKAKSTTKNIQIPDMQPPTCDLVASLFPVWKDRVNLADQEPCKTFHEGALVQKRPIGKLQEFEEEIDEFHRRNPQLLQLKEKREKVMQFLSEQINHFKAEKVKEVSFSDEHWKEENLRAQLTKANLEKWTKASRISKKDDDTKEMLILKQQIDGLQEQFKINESRWSVAHIKLQNQIEVLMKQNLELQDELRASEHQRMEITKKSLALHSALRKSEPLASEPNLSGPAILLKNEGTARHPSSKICMGQRTSSEKCTCIEPPSNKIGDSKKTTSRERMEPKKTTSREHREKTVFRNLRVRSPPPIGKRSALAKRIPFDPEMVIHRIPKNQQRSYLRKTRVPVVQLNTYDEESLAAYENDRYPLTSESNEDALFFVHNNGHRSSAFHQNEDIQDCPSKSSTSRKGLLCTKYKKREDILKKTKHPDGKVEWKFSDGSKAVDFPNGTWKEISADRKTTTVTFSNGDVQKFMPDQRMLYYYADTQTIHTTYPSGLEVIQFPNKQIEKYHPDGTKEIVYPDGTVKHLKSGQEETLFPDGTFIKVERNGDKTIIFNNGHKEIHTSQYKRREFPNGTIKTVYNTGHQKTKYISGRVRIKDEAGNIILDKN
ncbi:uncharacterized protein LOC103097496 isoform X2 [Monodelphis domestica]|uniref:uncharacterized protein LOC103097496 isoform X2 n=1 Tax=Monodelphis domestica TaxID=13616 RepID=UPI0024E1A461|nr:uncharacterized protein LOC103097496 isoform X2 [Monodelphis domestica]